MSLLSSRFPKTDPIWLYSNPRIVQRKAKECINYNYQKNNI